MPYTSVSHYRKAIQNENVLVNNVFTNACIVFDPLSFEIFNYIEKYTPDMEHILEFSIQKGIEKKEVQRLLQCLKECGFIYENSSDPK